MMLRIRNKSGLSVAEVLVAAGLGLLLLGLLHRVLVPILKASSRTSARTHLVQQANLALNSLTADLRMSSGSSLSYLKGSSAADSSVLTISAIEGMSNRGTAIYENRLESYIFDSEENKLCRRILSPGLPGLTLSFEASRPTLLADNQLQQLLNPERLGKILAADVLEFEPTSEWPPGPVITSRIKLSKEVAGRTQALVYEQRSQTAFRN